MAVTSNKRHPIPEILPGLRGGKPWQTVEGAPRVDIKHRTMFSGIGASAIDRRGRLHEMAHAKWSPKTVKVPAGVHPDTIQSVEDMRMHMRLLIAGCDLSEPVFPHYDKALEENLDAGAMDAVTLSRYLIAAHFTGDYSHLAHTALSWAAKAREQSGIDEAAAARIRRGVAISRIAKRLMEGRRRKSRVARDAHELPKRGYGKTVEVAQIIERLLDQLKEAEENDEAPADMISEGMLRGKDDPGANWGRLNIEQPRRPIRLPGVWLGKSKTNTDEGAIPVHFHRMPVDNAIFRRTTRKPMTPTILIDASGSMSLSVKDIKLICREFPYAKIAFYFGHGESGTLRILVDKHSMVRDEELKRRGGQNVVDGPALEWLGRESSPRIWVSDGAVTGCYDRASRTLTVECMERCSRHRIRMVREIKDVVSALKGKWATRRR